MKVNPKFEKWAKGFSGCHGGNLKGPFWLCGVEWSMEGLHVLKDEFKQDVSKPPQRYESREDVLRTTGGPHHLNIMFLKLMTATRGRPVQEYRSLLDETPHPFDRDSDFFKLNLFPIAFSNMKKKNDPGNWDSCRVATGLATANDYLVWCRKNRFHRMRSWVKRGQPKLIVAVGIGSLADFKSALGFDGVEHEEKIEGARLVWMANETSILAVVPSPNAQKYGLKEDRRVQAFGKRLIVILKRKVPVS